MKRTPLRRKTRLTAKKRSIKSRKRIAKASKRSLSVLQRKLWAECRRVADILWPPRCYTCDREIAGSNKQLGHLIPKASCGAYLKYDMRNLRWQCYHCNINLGGNAAEFYRRMLREVGQEAMDRLFADKNRVVNAAEHYAQQLIHMQKLT